MLLKFQPGLRCGPRGRLMTWWHVASSHQFHYEAFSAGKESTFRVAENSLATGYNLAPTQTWMPRNVVTIYELRTLIVDKQQAIFNISAAVGCDQAFVFPFQFLLHKLWFLEMTTGYTNPLNLSWKNWQRSFLEASIAHGGSLAED